MLCTVYYTDPEMRRASKEIVTCVNEQYWKKYSYSRNESSFDLKQELLQTRIKEGHVTVQRLDVWIVLAIKAALLDYLKLIRDFLDPTVTF